MIGLGAMGAPMARNLHAAGYLHRIWNRTRSRAESLAAELNVEIADAIADLARACDVIFLSISADDDVLQVVNALLEAIRPDTTVVDTSTISRETARTAARRLAGRDARYLDAPVSGGVEGARRGTLAMMVGGDPETLSRVRPVLKAVAGRLVHMGPVGAGQATKAVNQVMAAGINQAVSEALAFARALDLPMEKVIEIVGSGAAGNWFLTHRGPGMATGIFEPGFRISLHHKDLAICKQIADSLGTALPLVEMTLIHYRRLIEAGFGDEDISALFREKSALFGKNPKRPRKP